MHGKQFLIEHAGRQVSISGMVRQSGNHLIVLLHGFGCAKECFWQIFTESTLDEMSILALDFPGHGESAKLRNASSYSLQAFADIANAIIDLLSPEQVSFVGHSMGGAISLIASQARRDIYGIVDADGNLVAQDCGLVSRGIANQTLDRFLQRGYQEFLHRLQASDEPSSLEWMAWSAKADPVALHGLARSLVEWSDSGKLLDLLKSQKRAVYLHGDHDPSDYLRPELGGVAINVITGSGHFMMLDNPEAFGKAIADFFSTERLSMTASCSRLATARHQLPSAG